MILLLGTAPESTSFISLAIPDEYSPADVMPVIVMVWGNPGSPPPWVASDNEALAAAVSAEFNGAEIRALSEAFGQ